MSEPAFDTIVAPATPVGLSALAMVRIDGPGSTSILTELTRSGLPAVRNATLVELPEIDQCVVVRYAAPHSFTGNDLVELTLHGNPVLVEQVIAACVAHGARIAEPGEFTERAVLNGKLDLVQAESIADLINARTALQAKLSLSNLEGVLSRKATAVRQTLLEVIARLEAALDFSEEGYEFIARDEVRERLNEAQREIAAMAETYRRGHATATGLNAVILGRPNAGKSTLLNRLVGTDRAIVTPIPGTTRDIVRETIEIGGLPVTLADTAGLRATANVVEGIGVERARAAARSADLIIYLVDATVGLTAADQAELDSLDGDVLLVFTKADLTHVNAELSISAVIDHGIDELLRVLDHRVRKQFVASEGALVNERQHAAVLECWGALAAAQQALATALDEQMVLVDLYRAANSLGLLVGAITRDDILSEIFGKFCIGK
ncbi:MAG: tRNA uridine-5-carboxymethylaminomethyl(34) synthesis GTPase MnmE [Acidobacteria bacterium]|nr:tRNA uridine-5-carboxymethylaminomethyl(34) synthesis GTPase MnmE [Acidobacteriota bacterium]MBV9475834.1 tRNA uridine-5-carboxymethylaminomethyl(34) synthesis GTPase MnmE [Acidobacteriota bacterium]